MQHAPHALFTVIWLNVLVGQAAAQCTIPPIGSGFGADGPFSLREETFPNPVVAGVNVHVFFPSPCPLPVPVVFFQPGFGSVDPSFYARLVRHVVSRGYALVYSPGPFEEYPYDTIAVLANYRVRQGGLDEAVRRFRAQIDTTKVAFLGHSFGAGAVPGMVWKIVLEQGWGINGVFVFLMAPWYCYGLTDAQFKSFPSQACLLMEVFHDDRTTDHRIAKDIFETISIPPENKDYIMLVSDSWSACQLEADHLVPLSTGSRFAEEDALDYYGVYRMFDALAAHVFAGDSTGRAIALGHGSPEQRYMGTWPIGMPVRELLSFSTPEVFHPESFYRYPWSSALNPRRGNDEIPPGYRLDQNFPNPFNSATRISFYLPYSSWLTLTVYDLLGRRVAVVVDEYRDAGQHQILFPGESLASGVYVYRMRVGSYHQQKAMVLLR